MPRTQRTPSQEANLPYSFLLRTPSYPLPPLPTRAFPFPTPPLLRCAGEGMDLPTYQPTKSRFPTSPCCSSSFSSCFKSSSSSCQRPIVPWQEPTADDTTRYANNIICLLAKTVDAWLILPVVRTTAWNPALKSSLPRTPSPLRLTSVRQEQGILASTNTTVSTLEACLRTRGILRLGVRVSLCESLSAVCGDMKTVKSHLVD